MTTLEILDRLQGDALKDGELRKSFWQPVWKRILSLFFADYAGNLVMNCMKWTWYLPEKTSMPPCAAVPMAVEKTPRSWRGKMTSMSF